MCSDRRCAVNIRIRLLLMQEIERRNEESIEAWKQRKGTFQPRKKKAKRNKGKPKKRP